MKYLLLFLLAAIFFTSCKKDKAQDGNLITVNLIVSDSPESFKKTVILFESSDYLVKTNFETFINEYPFNFLSGYEAIKAKAISDTATVNTLKMVDYLKQSSDSINILAHYLETGNCFIFDKKSNSVIASIQMENYSKGEPMQSTAGRRFYIKGKLFLETIDMLYFALVLLCYSFPFELKL